MDPGLRAFCFVKANSTAPCTSLLREKRRETSGCDEKAQGKAMRARGLSPKRAGADRRGERGAGGKGGTGKSQLDT